MTTIKERNGIHLGITRDGLYTIYHVFYAFGVKTKGRCYGRWPVSRETDAKAEFERLVKEYEE